MTADLYGFRIDVHDIDERGSAVEISVYARAFGPFENDAAAATFGNPTPRATFEAAAYAAGVLARIAVVLAVPKACYPDVPPTPKPHSGLYLTNLVDPRVDTGDDVGLSITVAAKDTKAWLGWLNERINAALISVPSGYYDEEHHNDALDRPLGTVLCEHGNVERRTVDELPVCPQCLASTGLRLLPTSAAQR